MGARGGRGSLWERFSGGSLWQLEIANHFEKEKNFKNKRRRTPGLSTACVQWILKMQVERLDDCLREAERSYQEADPSAKPQRAAQRETVFRHSLRGGEH